MKKILFISLLVFLSSCAAKRSQVPIETTQKDSILVIKEVVKEVQLTLPVTDTIIKEVIVSADCQDEVNMALKNISFQKSSGNNSYKIKYDEANKQLRFYVNQAGQLNQYVSELEQQVNKSETVREVPVKVVREVNKLKTWQTVMICIGFFYVGLLGYKLINRVTWWFKR